MRTCPLIAAVALVIMAGACSDATVNSEADPETTLSSLTSAAPTTVRDLVTSTTGSTVASTTSTSPAPSSGSIAVVVVGDWDRLGESPLSERTDHTMVWTGHELLVWGGTRALGRLVDYGDGAAYDPATDTWRDLPASPIAGRSGHTAVWTGSEMLIWGGQIDAGCATGTSDGAAYDPTTDQWRTIAVAPGPVRVSHKAVWAGSELVVWGGSPTQGARVGENRCGSPPDPDAELDGLAYNVATDSWRNIATGPESRLFFTMDAAEGQVLVWGGLSTAPGDDGPTRYHDDGWSYDPASDQWRQLPPGPLSARFDHVSGWIGEELVIAGGQASDGDLVADAAAYDPAKGTWRRVARLPNAVGYAEATSTGRFLVVVGGCCAGDADAVAYDSVADTWIVLPPIRYPACDHCSRFAPVEMIGTAVVTWGGRTEGDPEAPGDYWAEGSRLELAG